VDVAVGDQVVPGQVIGTANNTGNSFGDHLHYTHWIDRYSNPKVAADPEGLHGDC
jgi:murein DD-endopeptidase MepM/ murein hydrolase activator NlpD